MILKQSSTTTEIVAQNSLGQMTFLCQLLNNEIILFIKLKVKDSRFTDERSEYFH